MILNAADKPKSLYDANPQAWDRIASHGAEALREMAKHFYMCADMDRALGYLNAVARWQRGMGQPSRKSVKLAKEWLTARSKEAATVVPKETPKAAGVLLLVACSPDVADKAKRVLAILGCEVTEV